MISVALQLHDAVVLLEVRDTKGALCAIAKPCGATYLVVAPGVLLCPLQLVQKFFGRGPVGPVYSLLLQVYLANAYKDDCCKYLTAAYDKIERPLI